MTYFSRVRIDTGSLAQMLLLHVLQGDVYAMHQLIWKLFPEDPDANRSFLFRQEFEKEQIASTESRRGLPLFYVLSQKIPRPVNGLLSVESKEFSPKIKVGDKLGFDLRANPIVARKQEGKANSCKHDILMDSRFQAKKEGITDRTAIALRMQDAVVNWFVSKGGRAGFEINKECQTEVTAYRQNLLRKRGQKEIRFSSVDLAGMLTVTDPKLFVDTVIKGIGSAKSFGCGLMLVRKIV
jgi:CRISPR system Cascade subunit CasE